MEFTRRRARGKTQDVFKQWFDETGHYRISWNREPFGEHLTTPYYACVRVARRHDGFQFWQFCTEPRPFRTFKAAARACEENLKVWQAVQALNEERNFRRKLEDLALRAVYRSPEGTNCVTRSIPVFVKLREEILDILSPPIW